MNDGPMMGRQEINGQKGASWGHPSGWFGFWIIVGSPFVESEKSNHDLPQPTIFTSSGKESGKGHLSGL
jgi:hypothetical protein